MFNLNLDIRRGIIIYIYIKTTCATNSELDTQFQESVCNWCRIKFNKADNLLLGCIYHSPNSSEENTEEIFNIIKRCAL